MVAVEHAGPDLPGTQPMVNAAKATAQIREQLSALAAHLGEQREVILQRWRIATENVAELTIASSLTRLQFNDHIPGVLDSFALRLRAWPEVESPQAQQNEKDQVTEHGCSAGSRATSCAS